MLEHLGLASSNGTKINPASPVINKGVRDSSVDIRAQTTKGEQGIAVLSDKTRNRGREKKKMKRKKEKEREREGEKRKTVRRRIKK